MVKISSNPPLTITKEALVMIEQTRIANNHKKTDFLRVKANTPIFGPSITFDMFFDDAPVEGDMAYNEGPLKLLLDADTAYLLVGSQLVRLPSGELKFVHIDTSACFDMADKPIMN